MKRFSILILTLCLCLTGCGKQTTEATAQIFAMDTVMEVAAYGEHAEQAFPLRTDEPFYYRNSISCIGRNLYSISTKESSQAHGAD